MSFKAITYLELWWPLRSEELAYLCNVGIKHNTEHFCEFILKLDVLFRRRRLYKIILNGFLAAFCSAERNHLCNFGRVHYGEHSFEIVLNWKQWFRRRFR